MCRGLCEIIVGFISMVENKGALEKEKFGSGVQTNMTPPYLPSYRPPYQQPRVPVRILKIVFFPYNPAFLPLFLTFIFFFPHPKFNFSLTFTVVEKQNSSSYFLFFHFTPFILFNKWQFGGWIGRENEDRCCHSQRNRLQRTAIGLQ